MEARQWITRQDAAEILQVTPQTISNYAAAGVISQDNSTNSRYPRYNRSEIEDLAKMPERKSVEEMQTALLGMQTELDTTLKTTAKLYEQRRREFRSSFGGAEYWGRCKDIIMAILKVVKADNLTERQYDILNRIVNLEPLSDIAEIYDLTPNRVRDIFIQGLRKVVRFPYRIKAQKEWAEGAIENLKEENRQLYVEIERLKNPEVVLPEDKGLDLTKEPFNIELRSLGLSVRSYNCLKAAEIETIGELVSYKRNDIMKIRNFGRKSMNELDILLAKYGLDFGMFENPQKKKFYEW